MKSLEIKILVDKHIHQLEDEHEILVEAWRPYIEAVGPFTKTKYRFFKRIIRWFRRIFKDDAL